MTEPHRPRRRLARLPVPVVVLLALAMVVPLAGTAAAANTTRLTATDNVSAAIAWSQLTYSSGAADDALLAREDLFADSLASGSAQAQLNAPLLLTDGTVLDPRTLAELQRLGVSRVLVLGGPNAVEQTVVTTLETAGYTVERVNGATRIETAVALASKVYPTVTQAVIARAYSDDSDPTRAFADTLATSNFAAATQMPVLFTESDRLTESTRAYLAASAVEFVTVAGGTDAVSDAVVNEINAVLDEKDAAADVVRVSGTNRFATASAMAGALGASTAGAADRVLLVDGARTDAWASGFAAAAQSAGSGAPLVLANGEELPPETAAFIGDADGRIPLICGPFTTPAACDAASTAMGNS